MNANLEHPSLACDLTAIPPSERAEHIVTAPQLLRTVQQIRELPNGYALRFPNEPGKVIAIAKYIEYERLCCPFFDFELEVMASGTALWLRLTGGEGVKELLKSGLLESYQAGDDWKKLVQTGGDPHFDQLVDQVSLPNLRGVLEKTPNS